MAIKILSLLHAGVRIPPEDEDVAKARAVYGDLLGLEFDEERGHIAGIPGFWVKNSRFQPPLSNKKEKISSKK